jgi:hypothetical protein
MKTSALIGRLRAGFSLALLTAFLPLQAQTPQNLLTNGSFETNSGGLAATGWTITNNLPSGPYYDPSLFVGPNAGASDGASFVVWNAGDSTPSASIAQTFTTIPGSSYTLKFDYVGGPPWRTDLQSLVVTVSNSDLSTQIATGDSSGNWKTFTYTFKATSTSSTVTFQDNLTNNTVSEDGALDNVVITANPVTVFASGISPVQTYDPIFPLSAYADPSVLSTPTQTVGPLPNDPRWANPHAAFSFPKGTHPWDNFPATTPFGFDALWINAWSDIHSRGAGGQSWTKYTTTVTGEGDFVLQFLADNVSWIYIDGALIGYQDWNWGTIGTGRYTIHLSGTGSHELTFVIWDGGGAAGGKFRLETTQSFLANGGGTLPPPPPSSDTTPPSITAPLGITKEATGPSGAVVTFTATATDTVDGSVPVTASPLSGSMFPINAPGPVTIVGLAASDKAHNTASASFKVTVVDTTPPTITSPGNLIAEATSPTGANVTFSASATDLVDGNITVTASAASGSKFALGNTTVTLTAKDTRNNSATSNFTVTVKDTTAPVITATMTAKAGGGDESTQSFTIAFSATDAVGVKTLTAVLNGLTVTNSQIVQLELAKSGKQESEKDDGKLKIKATAFSLVVTAADAAGNTSTKTVVPVFVKNGKDSEDKSSSSDSKGGKDK